MSVCLKQSTMDDFQSAMKEAKMEDLKNRILAVKKEKKSIPVCVCVCIVGGI